MRTYFNNVHTAEEAKELYRKLVKRLHPDCGGNAEEFVAMQNEFEAVWKLLKDVHTSKEGKTFTSEEKTNESAKDFMDIINKMVTWSDVTIEIIGSWIWVSGNTYGHREALKNLKFRYSSRKHAWYFHAEPFRKQSKKVFNMEQLREFYGSETVKTEPLYLKA